MTLGEKIQRLRKSKGLSQEQVAAQITVSRQAISKWELGEAMPDTDNVVQLSEIFGVSTDYLLKDTFESDMDISVAKRVEGVTTAERDYQFGVIVTIGFNAIFLVVEILAWYILCEPIMIFAGIIGHIASIVGLEAVYHYHKSVCQALRLRIKYYLISVWLVLFVPIRFMVSTIFLYYVTNVEYIYETIYSVVIYILISSIVSYFLYKKGKEAN